MPQLADGLPEPAQRERQAETIARLRRKSALGGRRQPAVAGRRIEGRRIDHALADGRRDLDQHQVRPQPRNLSRAAMAAAGTPRAGRACRAIALFAQGLQVRRSVGARLRFRAKAREALARRGMDFRKSAADGLDLRLCARQFFAVVVRRRASRMAIVCVRASALVHCLVSKRRPRPLEARGQNGRQATGRHQESPAVKSLANQRSPSTY